jgi:Family of unknown function (DUF6049)
MRRLAPLLIVSLVLLVPPSASAQEAQEGENVRLTLVRQTPWTEPGRLLRIEVRAANDGGATLRNLQLAVTVADRVPGRTAFELSLTTDATASLDLAVFPLRGQLRPGEARTFAVERDLRAILVGVGRHTTGVFPVKVELRSGGVPVSLLRTPAIHLHERPENPLNLAWTFVLHEPIGYAPDGTFLTPALPLAIAQGAPLATEIEALADMLSGPRSAPVDVVLSPALLTQLEQMSDGYRVVVSEVEEVSEGEAGAVDAARVLGQIRSIAQAPGSEVAAFPFSAPSIPALVEARLRRDLNEQLKRGAEEVARITEGPPPNPRLLHAPQGLVDQASLGRLAGQGVRMLLLSPGRVEMPVQDRGFAPPPSARLEAGANRTVTALVPDAGLQALLSRGLVQDDPRLAVQATLAELATIWLEQPGEVRGVAILLTGSMSLPARFFPPFIGGVTGAPWLSPVSATGLTSRVPPAEEPLPLIPSEPTTFSGQYLDRLDSARRRIGTLRSILVEQGPLPGELETMVLVSQAGEFLDLEGLAFAFLDQVGQEVDRVFARIRPDISAPVTVASRTGLIPVDLINNSGQDVRVRVHLLSPRLRFVGGATRDVKLTRPSQTLVFQVQAQTAGQFPVQVRVETPTGALVSEGQLVVRSSAYSRVALIITLGAALFLIGRWVRKLRPRARV